MSYKPWTDLNKITGASFKRKIIPTRLKEVTNDFNYVGVSDFVDNFLHGPIAVFMLKGPCLSNFRKTWGTGIVVLEFI